MIAHGINVFSGAVIEVRGGEFLDGVDDLIAPPGNLPMLAPGFIDLQVNGFAGVDYCSPEAPTEKIAASIRELFATGVTRFFPTVITGTPENMIGAIRNLARAKETLAEGAAIAGLHIEGPHISPEDGPRGAHPQHCVRPPDVNEFHH